MHTCAHCASADVCWFTPPRYADRAAVLLCLACRRLTIRSRHAVGHLRPEPNAA